MCQWLPCGAATAVAPRCAGRVGYGEPAVGSTVRLPRGEGFPSQSMLARKWEHAGSQNSRKRAEAALFFPHRERYLCKKRERKGRYMMAIDTLTRSKSNYGVVENCTWLPSRGTDAPRAVVSNSVTQGWNDAHVAALLFNVQCNDSYVAAFLMNLRV